MASKIERAREAVIEFVKTANPLDEFFMITFADKPEVISDFTSSVEDIQGKLAYTIPKGRTALMDAIYLAHQDAPGQVSQEGIADNFRRRRQSQPLHGRRRPLYRQRGERAALRDRHLRLLFPNRRREARAHPAQ